ncbi:hypothetical protein DDB_G0276777 [Dictyostelium discoideum AX4]|uniref:Uncharacterized protein DDB_G0276777 n=1 Tax=Dictyostelium discoideum TaxID=44689 RepID=Y8293_DICDI|nr:hypothetical protein DDB_G0276777 [Dictyostelium discoideum AX4]Q7KWY4.1 RecName: Full=Uncharacterized protein DDB_G0276777 [Dictyostelium discoideum]EAL68890.1 hypothetical protein DDB_G0276777 [Dictyostelium discoideum AX4]|eukprot:XP_642861.1 hypothetical protein DDB_G0276777 [Dictyostelium discoideum AX4]
MAPQKVKALELLKWGVYFGMPIIATIHVLDPDRLDNLIMKHQFVVYPPEAQTQEEFKKKELEYFEKRTTKRLLEQQQQPTTN